MNKVIYASRGGNTKKLSEAVAKGVGASATSVKQAVVFGTSAGEKTALSEIKSIMQVNGIPVSDSEFHCKGSFLLAHRGHPDNNDLKAAEVFAHRECKI